MNDAERDALIEGLRPERRSIAQRVFTPQRKFKAAAFVVAIAAGSLGLAKLGVNGHPIVQGMVMASPAMVVGLLVFLRHAWGQNFTALPLARDVTDAEPPPSQDDLADDLGQPVASEQRTVPIRTPAELPTVTVTVLPLPPRPIPVPIEARRRKEDH